MRYKTLKKKAPIALPLILWYTTFTSESNMPATLDLAQHSASQNAFSKFVKILTSMSKHGIIYKKREVGL